MLVADIEAAQRGDQMAFTRLVESTCVLVSSIALATVRDPDLSRDIAQDVFLSAWHDIRKLRQPSSFLPWLRQITRNRAHHVVRSLRRQCRRIEDNHSSELLEAVADPRPDAGQQLIAEERRRLVAETIDRLPKETREVVTLFYREGQSVAQVATLLDMSEAAVRQRLSRARQRLRDELLAGLGRELVSTAPGAAFVAGVAAAISVAAPTAASAVTIGVAGAKPVSPIAKIAVAFSGYALGAAGGIFGVVYGLRHMERTTYDDEERHALYRLKLAAVVTVIAGVVGIKVGLNLTHSAVGPLVAFSLFFLSLVAIYELWLPRILKRRYEAEMRADPIRALARRRRERILRLFGWSLGLLFGAAGLFGGLKAGGLL
ncbi:MAG TPA: RNA polymerase sigma factor [Vicinamibacterales bacterium]|nr:RNA polymerase sigma factor [Vicinamibacterales bacterium]